MKVLIISIGCFVLNIAFCLSDLSFYERFNFRHGKRRTRTEGHVQMHLYRDQNGIRAKGFCTRLLANVEHSYFGGFYLRSFKNDESFKLLVIKWKE